MLNQYGKTCSNPRPQRFLQRLFTDRQGATAIIVGVSMVGLLGMAGLATEVGLWYATKRHMQGAADSGAFSAAIAASTGENYTTEAKGTTAKYGFVDQQNGVTVSVNRPPSTGNYTGTSSAIEVIIQQPQTRMFSGLFLASNPTIAARAVGTPGSGNDCVLALDPTASGAITNTGSTTVDLINCGFADNSNSSSAFSITGSATLNAASLSVVGGISNGGSGNMTISGATVTGSSAMPDPYANVGIPSYSGCNTNTSGPLHGTNNFPPTGTAPAAPAVYVICGDVKANSNGHNGATVNFNGDPTSGSIFIIDGGSLTVDSSSTINVNNATIILTSSSGNNYGSVNIAGSATVNATAPTSGPTSGLAFYVDRNAPSATDKFNGGSSQNITGAVYMPSQTVDYTGGATAGGSVCTQIIGDQVNFSGNSNLQDNCTGYGISQITAPPKLVE
jgi:hypothetical protein